MDSSRRWTQKYQDLQKFYNDIGRDFTGIGRVGYEEKVITYNEPVERGKETFQPEAIGTDKIKTFLEPYKMYADPRYRAELERGSNPKYYGKKGLYKGLPIYREGNDFYFVPHHKSDFYFDDNVRPDKSLKIHKVGGRSVSIFDRENKELEKITKKQDDGQDYLLNYLRTPYGTRQKFVGNNRLVNSFKTGGKSEKRFEKGERYFFPEVYKNLNDNQEVMYMRRAYGREDTSIFKDLPIKQSITFFRPKVKTKVRKINPITQEEEKQYKAFDSLLQSLKKKIARENRSKRQLEMVNKYLTMETSRRKGKTTGRMMKQVDKKVKKKVKMMVAQHQDRPGLGGLPAQRDGRTYFRYTNTQRNRKNRRKANPTKFNDLGRQRPSFYQRTERDRGVARTKTTFPRTQQTTETFSAQKEPDDRREGRYYYANPTFFPQTTQLSRRRMRPLIADRGLRDPRIYRGVSRQARRNLLNDKRYISATEQAIIDRRIRQTDAEAKREKEIKANKKSKNEQEAQIKLLQEQRANAEKRIKDLEEKNTFDASAIERLAFNDGRVIGQDEKLLNDVIARSGEDRAVGVVRSLVKQRFLTDVNIIRNLQLPREEIANLIKLNRETTEYPEGETFFFKDFDGMGNVIFFRGRVAKRGESGGKVRLILDGGEERVVREKQIVRPEDLPAGTQLQTTQTDADLVDIMEDEAINQLSPISEASSGSSIASLEGGGEGFLTATDETPRTIKRAEVDLLERERARILQLIDNLTVEEYDDVYDNEETIKGQELKMAEYLDALNEIDTELLQRKLASNVELQEEGSPAIFGNPQEDYDKGQQQLAERLGEGLLTKPVLVEAFDKARRGLQALISGGVAQPEGELALVEQAPPPLDLEEAEGQPPTPKKPKTPPPQEEEEEELLPDPRTNDITFDRKDFAKKEVKDKIKKRPEGTIGVWSTKYPAEKGEKKMIFYTRQQWEEILVESGKPKKTIQNNLRKFDKATMKGEIATNDTTILGAMGLIPKGQGKVDRRSKMGQLD